MRQYVVIAIGFSILILVRTSAYAAGPDDVLGVWNTEGRDARIEIYKCGMKYCGRVVWLKDPTYPADSKEGTPGTPVLDHNNPDAKRRRTPLIGLPILLDFVFAGDNCWNNGKIYDSDNGKTYRGRLTLVSPHQLDVRGFIGILLIGGTTSWMR
jgi:uncharacterized protein (DUF2147 family)